MDNKVKQNRTQVYNLSKVDNLIGLIGYLLDLDKKLLNPINATSMSDNNGGRIIY